MKLYRTRTKTEYEWLMQELEEQGYNWINIVAESEHPDAPIIEVSELMETEPLAIKIQERNHKSYQEQISQETKEYQEQLKELTDPLDLINHHKDICEKLNRIYADKNHDYGNSFGKTYEKYGDISALVRISDKMNRIEQLVESGEQKVTDEALEDSLLDMANYLMMWAMELEEEK